MTATLHTQHLKRITIDVNSSMISYLEYSKDEFKMVVKFKRGRHKGKIREYTDVMPETFFGFLNAPSIGKALIHYLESRRNTTY